MALLAFEMPSLSSTTTAAAPVVVAATAGKKGKSAVDEVPAMPESISSLLDQSQRLKTATELNAAILTAQSHGKDPKLPGLMKMLVWGESLLSEKGADFPKCEFVVLSSPLADSR
jgi:glucose-induced degradation protein 8